MPSARARLLAMQTRFETSLPSMCLYCKSGWLGFTPNGALSVCCMQSANMPKTPKTVKGWKVPTDANAVLMMPINGRCGHFSPVNLFAKKAALLDALGCFDGCDDDGE